MMRLINTHTLDNLSAEAADNARLRKNLNIHSGDDSCCHRLFNAIEPGSYIRPHRHLDPDKDETFVIIRGKLGVIMFDNRGKVVETALVCAGGKAIAVDIPHGAFHTAVSLQPGTIFFEAKAGPYLPLTVDEKAPWSPEEGSSQAITYLEALRDMFGTD